MNLIHGDCLEQLQLLPENSVESCCCDPPYHLTSIQKRFANSDKPPADGVFQRSSKGFMGKTWDGGDIAFRPETWAEVYRVLKPGAHLLAFAGTRTYHRMACAIEDAGFEIRDTIHWTYFTGFPKSHNLGNGIGTALKPSHEILCLARKPLSESTVAKNVLRWGTGGINVDACRVGQPYEGTRPVYKFTSKGVIGGAFGNPKAPPFERLNEEKQGHKLGRWPANMIHDGSDEVVEMFPNSKSGAGDKHGRKPSTFCASTDWESLKGTSNGGDSGSAARFFQACPYDAELDDLPPLRYQSKASTSEREFGLSDHPKIKPPAIKGRVEGSAGANNPAGGMGRIDQPRANVHSTVKPVNLMRYLVKLITPPGGTVLDPFLGSGTTAIACVLAGFDCIGIEKEADYYDIAVKRVAAWSEKHNPVPDLLTVIHNV